MHTDKNTETAPGEEAQDLQHQQEDSVDTETLRWLLETEMSEPEETLFAIDSELQAPGELSGYELEVANRPMFRGAAGADNLENYIAEEIVISSDNQASDIYAGSMSDTDTVDEPQSASSKESMAIEFSRHEDRHDDGPDSAMAEGLDILGLEEDDDIGEKYLVIKRVKSRAPVTENPAVAGAERQDGPNAAGELPTLRLVTPSEGVGTVQEQSAVSTDDSIDLDDFPLPGQQRAEVESEFEELQIEYPGNDDTPDSAAEDAIEYVSDLPQGQEPVLEAGVAALVPQVVEAVDTNIGSRLQALGIEAGAVRAEVEFAADDAQVEQLMEEGFEPALAICDRPPAVLQQFGQQEIDALYLRLLHVASGDCWNRLFSEDFAVPTPDAGEAEAGRQAETAELALVPLDDEEHEDLFAGDLEAAADLDESSAAAWQPDDEDIDDIFADLDGDLEVRFDDGVDEAAAEPFDPAVLDDVEAAIESPAEMEEACDAAAWEAEQVFSEDIFDGEPGAEVELEAGADTLAADIDAMIDQLQPAQGDGDDICGLDVAEFAAAEESPETVEQPAAVEEVALAEPAAAAGERWFIPAGIKFAETSPGSGEIFPDFLDAFIEEGASELEKLEDAVAAWEKDSGSEPAYATVTRILHTIKGIAKGVGLHSYGTLVHNFETLLGGMPRPESEGRGQYFRIVNCWLDAAVRGMEHIREQRVDIDNTLPRPAATGAAEAEQTAADDTGTVAEAPDLAVERDTAGQQPEPAAAQPESVAQQPESVAPPAPSTRSREKQQAKQLADDGARALAAQQSVRITSEKLDHLLNLTNQAQQLGVRTAQGTARSKRAATEMMGRLSSVRSHIASIADRALRSVTALGGQPGNSMDALEMDQYSELQEAANILREGVEDLADLVEFASRQNVQVEALLKQQANVISSIGSSIRAARVVPVSRLVPGLRRLVRTLSVDLGKTVTFQVLNELGTLDRDDYARCQTILDHMMRNALDHGIEPESERLAAGKPATGQVTIDIRKAGADAVITLSDDGRGIDPAAMRESALRKGLDIDVDALSDEEAVRLVFHKGFSTAGSVSQISGRGVGMDIVLTELQEMGGDIKIESEVGRGTSFHIRVPSSITVNGALLVRAAEQAYAIPLGGLIAVEQVEVGEFIAAVESGSRLTIGERECEPAYLGTLCQTGEFPDAATWRNAVPVILAGTDQRCMAIAVDDVEEALEMVIRSLGTQFSAVPGVAGAATTAAGEAIVALDLNMLVASVGDDYHSAVQVRKDEEETLLALVVDDSRTQRMVATSQLETVGVETITAENGGVAIDLLNTAERLPDIILMDVEMPVKDGIQALREIRKSVRYGHIPVIMITSRTGLKHRSLAESAGCNGYMGKPFNFRMLVGQINELTGDRLQLS